MTLGVLANDQFGASVMASDSITMLLSRVSAGDSEALTHVLPLIYKDLHRIAEGCLRNERPGHTLQATALIHESYLRLVDYHGLDYRNRSHFFAVAARVMRQILVDHARARRARKRDAAMNVTLDENFEFAPQQDRIVVRLDDALKQLAKEDEKRARLIEMRFFGGMTAEDIAGYLDMPVHTVRRELRSAQAWLRREMER
jgi:RNA polymerase sigma factor (TIGR02999 family)